jgi:hypothetical protein
MSRTDDDAELDALRQALIASVMELAEHLLGKPAHRFPSEWRWGGGGGFSVTVRGRWKGRWKDFRDESHGDLLVLIMRELGCNFTEAMRWARGFLGMGDSTGWKAHVPRPRPERDIAEEQAANAKKRERPVRIWNLASRGFTDLSARVPRSCFPHEEPAPIP